MSFARLALPGILLAVAPMLASTPAGAQNCTCTCEQYDTLQSAIEDMRRASEQDSPGRMPPEVMQLSMCAGQCAMRWAQCADPSITDEDIERVERMQQQMNSPEARAARERAMQDAMRHREEREAERQRRAQAEADPGLPKDRLTAGYLQGMWCSVYGGQERTQWRFHADGSYEVGLPAGRGWAMQPSGDDLGEFRGRFEKLISVDGDGFVTEHRHGRQNVFTRGPC